MIRYSISLADLTTAIEHEKRGWMLRAKERTDTFRSLGKYQETSTIWSEVKPAYMRLQGDAKCAYCERKLEALVYGKVEQDVEHFRPKGNVKAWRVRKSLTDAGVRVTLVPESKGGYYLLPYHPFNYAAACKPCNSVLKRDYFPISKNYDLGNDDPAVLISELPLLIYPIGDFDADPETLIQFTGLSPQPVAPAGYPRHRALVTIDFFKLDDPIQRKNLFRERAAILLALFGQLEKMHGDGTDQEKARAKAVVEAYQHDSAPHANCARSFVRLFANAPDQARTFFDKAVDFISSMS